MFGSKQAHDARGHANAAWSELIDALESTRDHATDRAKGLGSQAGRRVTGAWDVLAGRPRHSSAWPIVGAIAVGLAAGWIASEAARRNRVQIGEAMASIDRELSEAKQSIDNRVAKARQLTTPS